MARRDSRAGAPRRSTALAAVLAARLLAVGCGREPAPPTAPLAAPPMGPPKRVLFITVDTLRADHLSAYGYPRATSPHLDRWAATGRLFERAIAQWPKTGSSFASMFTGRYPQTTGLLHSAAIRVPDEIVTLPEFLREQGYSTAAVVSNPVLTARLGWNAGFTEYLETWGGGEVPEDAAENRQLFAAHRVNAMALPLLERLKTTEKFFLWLHYTDPHAPYILPPGVENPFLGDAHDWGADQVPRGEAAGRLIAKERRVPFYVAQYDANVRYVDGKIHEILERARTLGLLDGALVVFTSDHGESLGEHGSYFEHGPLAYNTTLHVPLVVALPGRALEPARIPHPVELVDLYPTLRDLLAPTQAIAGLEGSSLMPFLGSEPPDQSSRELATRFELAFGAAGKRMPYTHVRSVQDRDWKLIYEPARSGRRGQLEPERFELYRLRTDPHETANLAASETEEVRRLRRALFEWMKEDIWSGQDEASMAANDREVRQALKALGYIK